MNEEIKKNDFVGFEYKDILVKKTMQSVYEDSFSSFGWSAEGVDDAIGKVDSVIMKFKRDRKIRNKAELTRLQKQFEACVSEIVSLEKAKIIKAATVAYVVGVIGTVFVAGSVFAVTGGNIPLCVILAIPGFIGWIVSYPIFRTINNKKTEVINPLIDQKYDELYAVCEKASPLLD
ncbi:hypothetical protein [Konateibacter massiliensis]|uniref:hypothetical protein n=1 Tax=Konateibacter massiliensis TaxID=2002841 RepID=UPI000C157A24|nr:hypothetical protein [Konateibacter massiliensis]